MMPWTSSQPNPNSLATAFSRADGHRVGRGYRTRHRANWRGPHEPDNAAPPWGPTASPRRPHAKGIRCREYAGTTHDLPWLLDEHTRRWGAYCPPSGGGMHKGGFSGAF